MHTAIAFVAGMGAAAGVLIIGILIGLQLSHPAPTAPAPSNGVSARAPSLPQTTSGSASSGITDLLQQQWADQEQTRKRIEQERWQQQQDQRWQDLQARERSQRITDMLMPPAQPLGR